MRLSSVVGIIPIEDNSFLPIEFVVIMPIVKFTEHKLEKIGMALQYIQ